jgi:hypothetical protein
MPRVCVGFDLTRIVDDIDGRGFDQVYAIGGLLPPRRQRAVWPHGLEKGHAVVIVAEGAGQRLIPRHDPQQQHDESGNPVFLDVGAWLKAELGAW